MWSDYFFYLMALPEKERNYQIVVIICLWSFLLMSGAIYEYINKYFRKKISK